MIIEVFGKQFLHFFSTKCSKGDKITPNKNDKCVSNDGELCQRFCDILSNIISELQIPSIFENISNVTDINDPVLTVINTFQGHPSIKNIRANNFKSVFSFTHTNEVEIKKIIRSMNVHKTCQLKDIPTKIIKNECQYFC